MSRLTKKKGDLYYPTNESYLIQDDGSNVARLLQIIGEYEELEEELGISLVILLKAKKVYFKYFSGDEIKESYRVHFDITRNILIVYEYPEDEFGNGFSLKEYGKTWALTREELEDE